ncbi:MAG: ACT domain-containing protein [Nitrososphaerota archaeon]|nr:ACT domain-containing protein [Candidatus Bathyarchaeota archaeon]MDW8048665.1 ACT domain-containing protein [Nitrososphaerota archaeon]
MRFDLTLALADRPGQLLRALEPIAKNGGNIISIVHERERPAEGYVPVSLVVDFPSKEKLMAALSDLKAIGVTIIKSEEVVDTKRLTVILVGKIDIKRFIDSRINGVRIAGFEASAPASEDSSFKIDLEVPSSILDNVMIELKRLAKEENALLITPIL